MSNALRKLAEFLFDVEGSYNHYAIESHAPCRFCPMRGECMDCGYFRKEVDSDENVSNS